MGMGNGVGGLQNLFVASGCSLSQVADAIGKSRTTTSLAINGRYHGSPLVTEALHEFFANYQAGSAGNNGTTRKTGIHPPARSLPGKVPAVVGVASGAAQAPKFEKEDRPSHAGEKSSPASGDAGRDPGEGTAPALTPGQKQAWVLMDVIRRQSDFGILIGPSGVGKTWVAKKFAEETGCGFHNSRLGQSLGGLLTSLCQLWRLPFTVTNDLKMERLCAAAKGRTLIVDEADLMVAHRSRAFVLRLIEVFRLLYENGCGVVLIGLPSLHTAIADAGETYVVSRIGYQRRVESPTEAQLSATWRHLVAEYPDALEKTGPVVARARRSGYFRYLEKLAELVALFDGDLEEALGLMFHAEAR